MSKSAFSVTGTSGGAGGGTATSVAVVSRSVTQAAHGLFAGQIVRLNGTNFTPALADTAVNAEALGIITEITDANRFNVQMSGYVNQGLAGLSPGEVYFLSATSPGAMTLIPPSTIPQVVKPIFVADSSTSGYLLHYRANIVVDEVAPGGTGSVVQTISTTSTVAVSGITAVIPNTTVPQITDGVEVINVSITPQSATNKLLIEYYCPVVSSSGSGIQVYTLCQTGVTNALQVATTTNVNNSVSTVYFRHEMLAGSTSPLTFSLRAGWNSGSGLTLGFLKGWTGTEYQYSGLNKMTLKVTEII